MQREYGSWYHTKRDASVVNYVCRGMTLVTR